MNIKEKKKKFLKDLASPSKKNAYKRYLGTPLRYAGGKTLATGFVIAKFPDNIERLVSPFLGGASIEIAASKELQIPVIGYDIFDILINYWYYQIKNPKKLAERLRQFLPTREEFKRVKNVLKKHWDNEEKLEGLELAAYYYFNSNTSYGPHFLGWPSNVYLNETRYNKMIDRVENFEVNNFEVYTESFENVMNKHKSDFLYCDPPYFLDGDSKTFVGMYPHRNFPIHHVGFRHDLLREYLVNHEGGFVLSYNDCSTIRDWYQGFDMTEPTWQYTFSQGDTRIGQNRKNNNNGSYIKKSHELLIWCPPKKQDNKFG